MTFALLLDRLAEEVELARSRVHIKTHLPKVILPKLLKHAWVHISFPGFPEIAAIFVELTVSVVLSRLRSPCLVLWLIDQIHITSSPSKLH